MYQEGAWFFCAYRGLNHRWIGLAKRSPFLDGHPVKEPGEIWFEFGDTEEEALAAIRRSVLNEHGQ